MARSAGALGVPGYGATVPQACVALCSPALGPQPAALLAHLLRGLLLGLDGALLTVSHLPLPGGAHL